MHPHHVPRSERLIEPRKVVDDVPFTRRTDIPIDRVACSQPLERDPGGKHLERAERATVFMRNQIVGVVPPSPRAFGETDIHPQRPAQSGDSVATVHRRCPCLEERGDVDMRRFGAPEIFGTHLQNGHWGGVEPETPHQARRDRRRPSAHLGSIGGVDADFVALTTRVGDAKTR